MYLTINLCNYSKEGKGLPKKKFYFSPRFFIRKGRKKFILGNLEIIKQRWRRLRIARRKFVIIMTVSFFKSVPFIKLIFVIMNEINFCLKATLAIIITVRVIRWNPIGFEWRTIYYLTTGCTEKWKFTYVAFRPTVFFADFRDLFFQRPHKAHFDEMTKYHSDEYIMFLRNIRPDNMSDYNKQMQRCN